jgi:hypothetical protein
MFTCSVILILHAQARQACQVFKANASTLKPRQDVLEEMLLLDRVASQNGVAVQLLMRSGGRQMAVRFEQLHHRWFPAVTLKTAAVPAAASEQQRDKPPAAGPASSSNR